MTEEEMRTLIATQKEQIQQKDQTIEALTNKDTTNTEIIKNLNKQVNDLKVKNHDLFLKVVQNPGTTEPNKPNTNEEVKSLSDITNILLGGQ